MAKATLERIRGTVGLWSFAHESLPPARSAEPVALAESLGFSAYWYPEAGGREALVNASLLTAGSTEIVVGSAIASIWARDASAAIGGARTLAATSAERYVLGLGVSHGPLVERRGGQRYERPLATMAAYLQAMAAASMYSPERGEAPPVLLAALGPKMLELAATRADGALPYLVTPEHTATARATMGPDAFLAVEQAVALTEDDDEYHDLAARHLSGSIGLPNYLRSWRRLGFDDFDFVAGGSSRLQDALVAHGDEPAIWARVEEHFAAGADHVSLQILSADPMTPPYAQWRRLSPVGRGG
jgi:probable F420-dependent oxidoreductase